MNLKDVLIGLKGRLLDTKNMHNSNTLMSNKEERKIKDVSLSEKIDEYIQWDYENMIKGQYTNYGEYSFPKKLRDLIEKMAVWYELRYPDYEINRRMRCCAQEELSINDIMFNENKYINELLDENSDVRALDWDEFYNASVFFKALTWEERDIFKKKKYPPMVSIDSKCYSHLHLNSKGFVIEVECVDVLTNNLISNEQLIGMHIIEVIKLLKENCVQLPKNTELEYTIKVIENYKKEREGLLDAVMFRIIERGGNRIGPRRAFLFAKEFKRNIDIPMMYAIDRSDPGLKSFINLYIQNGGSRDLLCYEDYFYKILVDKEINIVSIQDLILTKNNNAAPFYTPEEKELYQRLINVLSSQVDYEEVRKEQVKQLRLQRKIEKSKHNK